MPISASIFMWHFPLVYLCLCIWSVSSYKDKSHIGLRAHPTLVWHHLNLANYICIDPISHSHVLGFKPSAYLFGDTIQSMTRHLGWDLTICISNNFPGDVDALQGPQFENHRFKISIKQDYTELKVGLYYRNNCAQLSKCAELILKHIWKIVIQSVCD